MRQVRKGREGNITTLLSELGWAGGEEWLNRRNDDSIKLYKEIVSVVEMDGSVVEEYVEGMQGGQVGKEDINRFIKYAQFMRTGNHAQLQAYHAGWLHSNPQQEWQPEHEEETFPES